MNFKHSLLLIILIIFALISVNFVSADGFFGFGEEEKNIATICGVEYNIPEKFHENVNASINNESLNDGGFAYCLTSRFLLSYQHEVHFYDIQFHICHIMCID